MIVNTMNIGSSYGFPAGYAPVPEAAVQELSAAPVPALLVLNQGYSAIGGDYRGGPVPQTPVPSPYHAMPASRSIAGAGYYGQSGTTDVGSEFEQVLRDNPSARAAFEQSVGGTIYHGTSDSDGRISIVPNPPAPYHQPMPTIHGNPHAHSVHGMFSQMNYNSGSFWERAGAGAVAGGLAGGGIGALAGGVLGASGRSPFRSFLTGGLGGIAAGALLGGLGGGGGGGIFGFGGMGGPMGGFGGGSWNPLAMPGRINNTNPAYERMHQAQVSSVLSDPSLSVEDKVTLMLMLIMKKMDRDIERQLQYINMLQQQQSKQGKASQSLGKVGKAAGFALGGGPVGAGIGGKLGNKLGGAGSSPSVDVESMKVKRMIDKRSQMFEILKSIIDKYNETAKGIIQSINR